MADIHDIGEPESSDDSVSLTSTVPEWDRDFEVDCILAESTGADGVVSYLTKWTGYPEVESTWQKKDSFNDTPIENDVFDDWEEKKKRVARKQEEPFDLEAWETRNEEFKQETIDRRRRRQMKKARLNKQINSPDSTSEDEVPLALIRKNLISLPRSTSKAPTDSASASRGQSRATSAAIESPSVRSASTDSYIEELKTSKAAKDAKRISNLKRPGKKHGSPKQPDLPTTTTSSEPKAAKKASSPPKQLAKIPPSRTKPSSDLPEPNSSHPKPKRTDTTGNVPARSLPDEIQKTNKPHLDPMVKSPVREPSTKKPYSGTARAPVNVSSGVFTAANPSRTGGVRSGPARFATAKARKIPDESLAKRVPGGVDVTANWNSNLQAKKRRAYDDAGKAPKPYKTLQQRNNARKGRRNEPAPDPAQLVFIDPKTGKAPKKNPDSSIAATGAMASQRTPFEKYQEGLAQNVAETRHAEENETTMHEDDPACTSDGEMYSPPPAQAAEGDQVTNGIRSPDLPRRSSLSESNDHENHYPPPAQATEGDQRNSGIRSPDIPRRGSQSENTDPNLSFSPTTTRPQADWGPPVNAPAGPRADALRKSSISSKLHLHYTPPDASPTFDTNPKRGALTCSSPTQSRSSVAAAPTMGLMATPSALERYDLFTRFETHLVLGNFVIGSTLEDLGRMKLAGLDKNIQQLLLTVKQFQTTNRVAFKFKKICTAPEYEKYFQDGSADYVGSGYVIPYPESQEKYESIVEVLAYHLSGGICFAREFTMVIWPAKAPMWKYLEDKLPPIPPGATLRFAVREPMPPELAEKIELPVATRLIVENSERHEEIKARIEDEPIQPGEKHINMVFRDMFDINFERLIASNGPQQNRPAKNFFLCFIPAGCETYEPDETKRNAIRSRTSEEHDLFVEFLQANGAENIYSMQDIGSHDLVNNGAWECFRNTYKSGAIIIHDSCRRVDQLPHLNKLLLQGAMNVWLTSLSPMDSQTETHPHLVRVFPHGGVILLTISLILYHPYEALKILRWFRLILLPMKPSGTWKIAMHPRPREWLLDIQDLCDDATLQSPFGFPKQVFADIYQEVWILLNRDQEPFGLMVEDWDGEIPTPDAPILSDIALLRARPSWTGESYETAKLDHDAIHWNDEELIQWFSEWAGSHLDEHRKFQVVLGYPRRDETGDYVTKCYEKGYGYLERGPNEPGHQEWGLFLRKDGIPMQNAWERNFLEIMSYETCFSRNNIPEQAKVDAKHEAWRQRLREDTQRMAKEAEKERKEERQAAKHLLNTVMQLARDKGCSEEEVIAAGRRRLMYNRDEIGSATDNEIEECKINMDAKQSNAYGRLNRVLKGTKKEQEIAVMEIEKEKKRVDRKESLGWEEKTRAWEDEVQWWAAKDRENRGQMDIDDTGHDGGQKMRGRREEKLRKDARSKRPVSEEGEISSQSQSQGRSLSRSQTHSQR